MRFRIREEGGVNAELFIKFLRRLMIGSKNSVFLIVDRGPAHIAKKTKAFVASLGGRLRLLPPAESGPNSQYGGRPPLFGLPEPAFCAA
jgi:hypothetical protein